MSHERSKMPPFLKLIMPQFSSLNSLKFGRILCPTSYKLSQKSVHAHMCSKERKKENRGGGNKQQDYTAKKSCFLPPKKILKEIFDQHEQRNEECKLEKCRWT